MPKKKGGRGPRQKGFSFEREVVNFVKELGGRAERCYGSNGRTRGLHEEVDLILEGEHWQAKRPARFAKWHVPHESVQGVIFRGDGNTNILMTLPLEHYIKLRMEVNELRGQNQGD